MAVPAMPGVSRRRLLLEEVLHGLAAGGRGRADRASRPRSARALGQHGGESDVGAALRFVLGVAGDETLGGFGAGVPAAEW